MTPADQPASASADAQGPASFLAAATALQAIDEALHAARHEVTSTSEAHVGSEQALASLLLLRQVREQLAGWETGLIETARNAGASWADLARPLGVASRQAAERRYLRIRPGTPGSTGEQRVRATRDRRAADRTVTAWARANAANLRQLAGQITAATGLPAAARGPIAELTAALAGNDAAALVGPLTLTQPYLASDHPDLAARIDDLVRDTDRLRPHSGDHRRNSTT
ncbi:type III effector protein [Streptomyces herbicida]|uniref:type III effector protein n=1 Tax=Streptomyces herbicida TaxID=3065675 RepID=UPI00292F0560|nr:type III effector protein [Streptomyces sp. NEAU-HV9]